jgi:ABC-type polysaccharide/polyol phosphate export permease
MVTIIKEFWRYRELLLIITVRDIKARYKQTILGISWAIFVPLVTMLTFSLVFGRFMKIDTQGIPYPIFAYCGILPWTFFANSLSFAINSLVLNAGLLTKIYFPREVFPIASIIACFVDFCIASLILVGLMVKYGVVVKWVVVIIPLILGVQIIFTSGLALIFSMANLFFRDIKYVFQVILPLWMFATPVVYQIPEKYQWLYVINPMAPLISSYRTLVLEGRLPNLNSILPCLLLSVGLLIIGGIWFHKKEFMFAENV